MHMLAPLFRALFRSLFSARPPRLCKTTSAFVAATKSGMPKASPEAEGVSKEELLFDIDDVVNNDATSPPARRSLAASEHLVPETVMGLEVLSVLMDAGAKLTARSAATAIMDQGHGTWHAVLRKGLPARASGPNDTGYALKNLTHEFVVVKARDGQEEVIVEVNFRDTFALPRAGTDYRALVASLPQVFVGSRVSLFLVVKEMGEHLKTECQQLDMSLPPWRTPSALLSKWIPKAHKDTPITTPSMPPASYPLASYSSFSSTSTITSSTTSSAAPSRSTSPASSLASHSSSSATSLASSPSVSSSATSPSSSLSMDPKTIKWSPANGVWMPAPAGNQPNTVVYGFDVKPDVPVVQAKPDVPTPKEASKSPVPQKMPLVQKMPVSPESDLVKATPVLKKMDSLDHLLPKVHKVKMVW